ncbi:ABC transporter substrate-binding protein [Bacillus massiliglaciei]|uniref:ABC transporter substrate-binding protein n=1 Tax=Bacillus massiliglaciei TaxID=1816693 RepID=UPI000AEBB2D9|nr:ABC transporter substrate-binding protein [Bacillus massiliglaciei]
MKKMYRIWLTVLTAAVLLVGCNTADETKNADPSKEKEPAQVQSFPVTVKDAIGEEVTIEKKPERIVSLIPSNTEVVFALGRGKQVVGGSDYDNYPEETKDIEKVGGTELNVEKIISLNPDLVLAHESTHNSNEGVQQLKDAGLKVVIVNDGQSFKDVYKSIKMIGQAAGEQEKADQLVADMKEKLSKIEEKAKAIPESDRKKALIEVSPAPEVYVAGKNTFMDEMLALIHADNAAEKVDGWAKLDEESMIQENPDVIITTYGYYTENPEKQILSRKGWENVGAVKNEQVYDVHSDLVTRSGPRLVEGVEELAKAIYPDTFEK